MPNGSFNLDFLLDGFFRGTSLWSVLVKALHGSNRIGIVHPEEAMEDLHKERHMGCKQPMIPLIIAGPSCNH